MNKKKRYHHGDLQNALICAAITILNEEGIDALTLRKVAAKAGVSHSAPAHHFDGLGGLISALAAVAFLEAETILRNELDNASKNPKDQLQAMSVGYLKFSRTKPALFDLTMASKKKFYWTDEVRRASAGSYGILTHVVSLFEPSEYGPGVNENLVWSLIHGYTMLKHSNRLFSDIKSDTDEIAILLEGLALKPKKT